MADEITVLAGNGSDSYTLLFLFPIPAPKQVAGSNVVPRASDGLPQLGQAILSQAEKDTIDGGTVGWETISFRKDPALTAPELLARVREIYTARKATYDDWYDNAYQHAGQRFNAA